MARCHQHRQLSFTRRQQGASQPASQTCRAVPCQAVRSRANQSQIFFHRRMARLPLRLACSLEPLASGCNALFIRCCSRPKLSVFTLMPSLPSSRPGPLAPRRRPARPKKLPPSPSPSRAAPAARHARGAHPCSPAARLACHHPKISSPLPNRKRPPLSLTSACAIRAPSSGALPPCPSSGPALPCLRSST
ncbi:hypothetical protein MPTK1_4g08680 [Marchantia polymorpha subsp. ruderalis]|uniref:Uncharacterized protein n=2 Tax=Marchantia polymorpha TaxID=3197 RepID=A0AAF6B7U3_MARPO|nr:hypothetical protein MARPO_0157s0011 [Marchantia polymorpha]BBN08077.1 hypothetical protein Mp_4g08680 [Marchantia polymorpha subsp. ruderalis]|eukprot:PTQ28679.1 hypothetical protein MARPO_0157s0011 [Marchantia polymorpha]